MSDTEVYVSTDIEADGPIPFRNSMLSFGSAAFTLKDGLISTYSANLELYPGASPDPKTMTEFWDKNPEAWAACRKDTRDPVIVMPEYVKWVKGLPGSPVFVGYPVTFDMQFMYAYMIDIVGESPFSFSGLDVKTYAMALMKKPYRKSTKRNMPSRWFSKHSHTHVALSDATEQGYLFMSMLKENVSGNREGP